MNKNLLIKQNNELFSKIQILKSRNSALNAQVTRLNFEIEDYKAKIKNLENEISLLNSVEHISADISTSEPVTEPISEIDTDAPPIELPDDFNYASDVIGNIVIKAAGFINELTVSAKDNKKELINLILGRTEIAKAEILNAVSSDVGLSAKQELIDTQCKDAVEYFKSVIEQ